MLICNKGEAQENDSILGLHINSSAQSQLKCEKSKASRKGLRRKVIIHRATVTWVWYTCSAAHPAADHQASGTLFYNQSVPHFKGQSQVVQLLLQPAQGDQHEPGSSKRVWECSSIIESHPLASHTLLFPWLNFCIFVVELKISLIFFS